MYCLVQFSLKDKTDHKVKSNLLQVCNAEFARFFMIGKRLVL